MKRTLFYSLMIMILCTAAFANDDKMIVNDYFLQIPEEYIKADVRQRAMWIDNDDAEQGNLEFSIPASQFLDDEDIDATIFGVVQLFPKDKGGMVVGMSINVCIEGSCNGNAVLLEYNKGKWTNVTSKLMPEVDPEEIYSILKDSPAYEKPLEEGEEIPLVINFVGYDKTIQFLADCKESIDGGVVAKMFKWNGESFEEFEYEMSPE